MFCANRYTISQYWGRRGTRTHNRVTCYHFSRVAPDPAGCLPYALSNMSMNSFVEQVGLEPTIVPYFFTCRLLWGLEPHPECLRCFTIYHRPFISIPKDMIFISIRQLFFNFFLIKNPNLFFDPGTLLIICILYYIISYLGTSLFRFVIICKAKDNIPT